MELVAVYKEADSNGPYYFGIISPNCFDVESLDSIVSIVPLKGVSKQVLKAFKEYYESFPEELKAE